MSEQIIIYTKYGNNILTEKEYFTQAYAAEMLNTSAANIRQYVANYYLGTHID